MTNSNPPQPPIPDDLVVVERDKLKFAIECHARQRWWHEDDLINQRTTWLLTTQGVLGGAYGYLQYRGAEADAGLNSDAVGIVHFGAALQQFSKGLMILGSLLCVAIFVSIFAAQTAQGILRSNYPGVELGVSVGTTSTGHIAGSAVPLLCLVAWLGAFLVLR